MFASLAPALCATLLAGTLAMVGSALAQTTPAPPASPPRPPVRAPVPAPQAPAAPAAQMPNARLVGVILKEGRAPVALIEIPPQRQALYRVGDTVAEAQIEQIHEDRAIVRYRGQQVVLRLATSPGTAAPAATPPGRFAPPPTTAAPAEPDAGARMRDLTRRLRDNPNDAEAGAELRRLRIEQLQAPVSASDLAQSRTAPDVASAQPAEDGVRLTEVTEGGVLARLGLRAGDIVRSVNHRAVGPDHSLGDALVEASASGESMQIELNRGGAQTTQEHRLVP